MTAKLTAFEGSRCAAITCVTPAGSAAPAAPQTQAGMHESSASAAFSNTFE